MAIPPLAEAARYGHAAIVISLLEAGGSTQIKNDVGNTPQMRAEVNGHKTIAKRLLSAERPNYKGFTKENNQAVSRHEILEASNMSILKVFNFATQEVTTVLDSGVVLQQFNEISRHRIEEAAEALTALDGNPGDLAQLKTARALMGSKRVK